MMNAKTALKKAQDLFGAEALVRRERCGLVTNGIGRVRCSEITHLLNCQGKRTVCTVGRFTSMGFFCVEGRGDTFEDAFAKIERNSAHTRQQYCRKRDGHNPKRRCRLCHYRGKPKREPYSVQLPDGTWETTDETWDNVQEESGLLAEEYKAWRAGNPPCINCRMPMPDAPIATVCTRCLRDYSKTQHTEDK